MKINLNSFHQKMGNHLILKSKNYNPVSLKIAKILNFNTFEKSVHCLVRIGVYG